MRVTPILCAATLIASVSACAPAFDAPGTPPYSTDTRGAASEPQSPNSLPAGAAVNAPMAPRSGVIGTAGGLGPR